MTHTPIRPFAARPCTLVVCRGCCCGDSPVGQLARLRAEAAASGGRFAVRTSDCLGPCGQANVIVVQPSTEARRGGARAVWIGWASDDASTDEIVAWAQEGGPGVSPIPPTLDLQTVPTPSRRG
ncbi:(2Fe-2S) ferredoxin domain-containing protein [Streptomyces sp. NPDC020681]|uniref:(2Fe-2S) ferredoxin domain-containing protein n=1 Tax=Streptomyces sp. NPDC020681 TaxID=3365083 RepID=UPI00378B2045